MELLQRSIKLSSDLSVHLNAQRDQLDDIRQTLREYQELLQTELDKQREIE